MEYRTARMLLVMALVAFLTNACARTVQDVRFSPTPPIDAPGEGSRVLVDVRDERPEDQRRFLGQVHVTWTKVRDRNYVLTGEDSVAARLARDMVAALRARGYRADQRRGVALAATEPAISLTIAITTMTIDVSVGERKVFLDGIFVVTCTATLGDSATAAWSETIEHAVRREYLRGDGMTVNAPRAIEGGYWSGVVEIVHRFSAVLRP